MGGWSAPREDDPLSERVGFRGVGRVTCGVLDFVVVTVMNESSFVKVCRGLLVNFRVFCCWMMILFD